MGYPWKNSILQSLNELLGLRSDCFKITFFPQWSAGRPCWEGIEGLSPGLILSWYNLS